MTEGAKRLEDGYSKRAPQGMVALAFEAISQT